LRGHGLLLLLLVLLLVVAAGTAPKQNKPLTAL
jgi:hypothetical protein